MKNSGADPYLLALRLLTGRDYTVAGIARKLQARDFSGDKIAVVLERLQSDGFLDDRRYAERFISNASETGRYVGYRLKQELFRRGISRELVSELLDSTVDPEEEKRIAREILNRRYPCYLSGIPDEKERRRAAAFLQRRGFSSSVVWAVLRNAEVDSYEEVEDDIQQD